MDGSQSLLAFEGALRVHGLFDFLLNDSHRAHGDDCDVPLLLAPAQFAHAALRSLQPKVRVWCVVVWVVLCVSGVGGWRMAACRAVEVCMLLIVTPTSAATLLARPVCRCWA